MKRNQLKKKIGKVNDDRVERCVDNLIKTYPYLLEQSLEAHILPIESFVKKVAQFSTRLFNDLFCDERFSIKIMGHQLRWFITLYTLF